MVSFNARHGSHQATLRRLVVGVVAALVASLLAAAPAVAQTGVFDDVVDDAYYSVPVAALARSKGLENVAADAGFDCCGCDLTSLPLSARPA